MPINLPINGAEGVIRTYPITGWLPIYGRIRDINGQIIKPKPNVLQKRIEQPYVVARAEERPCREIGLKPRKKGYSTAVASIHYCQLAQYPHEGVIMGDKADTSGTVFNMMGVYAEHDEFPWQSGYRTESLTKELKWDPHNAIAKSSTAQSRTNIRGMTPQVIHGTETAHWESSEVVLLALMNAIPSKGFNSVFLESTPAGAVGEFYNIWKSARWPRVEECPDGHLYWKKWESICPDNVDDSQSFMGDFQFVRVFAAWFEFDDSFLPLDDHQKNRIIATMDEKTWYRGEKDLIKLYGRKLPDGRTILGDVVDTVEVNSVMHKVDVWDQLAWRRMIIQTKCGSNTKRFDQEYPRDPESCFLSSGRPFFDGDSITYLRSIEALRRPIYGNLNPMGEDRAIFTESDPSSSTFVVWEKPSKGLSYLVVADPAVGEDQTEGEDPDRHGILVLRKPYKDSHGAIHKAAVVARVASPNRAPVHVVGEYMDLLSRYYGRCMTITEMNNSGLAVITKLRDLNVPQFHRTEFTPQSGKRIPKIGWKTKEGGDMTGTRRLILNRLHEVLRYEHLELFCPNLIHEINVFCEEKGKLQAPEGEHDDDVLALAIGIFNLEAATVYGDPVIVREMPEDLKRLTEGVAAGSAVQSAHDW